MIKLKELIKEEKIDEQSYSSKEAKMVVDGALKDYATILRKAQQKVIKDWMSKAKAGVIDYFDLTKPYAKTVLFSLRFLARIHPKDPSHTPAAVAAYRPSRSSYEPWNPCSRRCRRLFLLC